MSCSAASTGSSCSSIASPTSLRWSTALQKPGSAFTFSARAASSGAYFCSYCARSFVTSASYSFSMTRYFWSRPTSFESTSLPPAARARTCGGSAFSGVSSVAAAGAFSGVCIAR